MEIFSCKLQLSKDWSRKLICGVFVAWGKMPYWLSIWLEKCPIACVANAVPFSAS